MRRWLALLLLVWLPLQFTWAAVVNCCPHDSDAGPRQVARHDAATPCHTTAGDPHLSDDAHTASATCLDLDCSHCHGYCLALPDVAGAEALPVRADAPPMYLVIPRTKHTPAQPERPQWPGLA